MRIGSRGLYDSLDIDPDADNVGVPQKTRSGWKYSGVQESRDGLLAQFRYSVEVLRDGEYNEDPVLSSTVMLPNRLFYTLQQMEYFKAEKLFIISVPEKVLDQGIQSLRAKLLVEQAAAPVDVPDAQPVPSADVDNNLALRAA